MSFWQKIKNWFLSWWPWGSEPQPDEKEPIRGLMASDMAQMMDLKGLRKDDLKTLKEKGRFNLIYCPLDLAIIHNGIGAGTARPHIGAGRTETEITDLAVKNIEYLYSCGFRVMIAAGNEPSVRKGWSHLMSGLGFRPGITPSNLYTNDRLVKEKACLQNIIKKVGNKIYAIMLFLEPSISQVVPFERELAKAIRAAGYKGKLYAGGVGSGCWNGDGDVRTAPSQGTLRGWLETKAHLKNADGMAILNGSNASSMIPQLTSSLGLDGGILYFDAYRGNAKGPGILQDWMYKYNKW